MFYNSTLTLIQKYFLPANINLGLRVCVVTLVEFVQRREGSYVLQAMLMLSGNPDREKCAYLYISEQDLRLPIPLLDRSCRSSASESREGNKR